ncbi:MAG: C25 family cysteine peptidase, partial [Planctomycetota bacterium]
MCRTSPVILLVAAILAAPASGQSRKSKGFHPETPSGDMPYVIVTTQELASSFVPLASWKTRTGLPAQIVTVEAVCADRRNVGTDPAEKLRSFLRRAHENWNTKWVVLGGHITEVPARATYMRRGKHSANGNISDLYFGDVLPGKVGPDTDVEIYNWNADGDGRFGEGGDGHDLLPELYVSRLPFQTKGQVDSYLDKYFTYVNGKGGE